MGHCPRVPGSRSPCRVLPCTLRAVSFGHSLSRKPPRPRVVRAGRSPAFCSFAPVTRAPGQESAPFQCCGSRWNARQTCWRVLWGTPDLGLCCAAGMRRPASGRRSACSGRRRMRRTSRTSWTLPARPRPITLRQVSACRAPETVVCVPILGVPRQAAWRLCDFTGAAPGWCCQVCGSVWASC